MKRLLVLLPFALAACDSNSIVDPAASRSAAVATAPGQNKLQCFDGTTDGGFGGTCTLNSNGAKGSATLANTSTNPSGDYAGAYFQNSNLNGQTLGSVKMLNYNYTGSKTPTPGELSLNLPIDSDGNGTTEFYAFIDAAYCGGTRGSVDVINDANCGIWAAGVTFYPNWAAFVAAYPGAKVSNDIPFIIAERTPAEVAQTWVVSNVTIGKPGK